jgi:hypothetical protein
VPPFPATAAAEGAQFNVPPSLRESAGVRGLSHSLEPLTLTLSQGEREQEIVRDNTLRTAKEHKGSHCWQELTAQGEGTLGNLADRITPAGILHKS